MQHAQAAPTAGMVVTYAVGMAAAVYVILWGVMGLIGPDGLIGRKEVPLSVNNSDVLPVTATAPIESPEPPPVAVETPPEFQLLVPGISGLPGDSDGLVGDMQRALTRKGYRAGSTNSFDPDTVAALQAFQDHNGLTVEPRCNRQCWNSLGLADPK